MNRTLSIFLFVFTLVVFNSCKHDNFENFVGPSQCPTDKFVITEPFDVSLSQVDFNTNPGVFGDTLKAKFNEVVTWTINITGGTSGATKTFKGRSAEIDTVWFGQSSTPGIFFISGEDVTVELSISCLSEKYTKTIKVVESNKFKSNIGPYTMISDFEGAGYVSNTFKLPEFKIDPATNQMTDVLLVSGYNGAGWSSYFTPSTGILNTFGLGTEFSAAQGSKYLTLKGQAQPTSWFVGGMYINPPVSYPTTNPNDLYFNAFISSGSNTTTTLGITLKVSDTEKYNYIMPLTWTGWKYVALRLSDFKNAQGRSLTNISNVTALDMGLNCASKQGQTTEVNMDFLMISQGGPFFK